MDILVVNWQDITNPLAGGAEVHCHEIFSRIAGRGHRVTLCCSSYPGALPSEVIDGVEVIRRGSRSFFNLRFPLTYLTTLKAGRFDIVVEDLNKIPFFTPLYVRRPLVGIAHHLFGKSIYLEAGFPAATYVYAMERAAIALYRGRMPFMVVSPSTRQELLDCGFPARDLAIVHNCVDHARYSPGTGVKSPTPLIVCLGRLKKYKGVDQFLRAFTPLMERSPGIKAVIAGDGDDRPRLESLSRELGIQSAVEFTGYLTEERKVDLLRRAWFQVATSSKEGWGLTIVEANACGTPAIATDVPGLRDSIRNNETGLLYPFGDLKVLTEKMILLLDDGELRKRLSINAIAWAKTFDWENAADAALAFLHAQL